MNAWPARYLNQLQWFDMASRARRCSAGSE
jgi:hypothetical protein